MLVLTLAAFAGAIAPGNAPIIVGVESPIATIVLPNGRVAGMLPSGFVITNNTIILFSTAMAGETTFPITITNAMQTVAQTIMLTAQVAPPIGGGLVINSDGAFFLVGAFGSAVVATLTPITGGSAPNGYSITIQSQVPADFLLATVNAMTEVRFSKNGAATVSATIIVDDDNEHIAPLSLFLTATAVANVAVSLTINSQSGPVGSKYTVGNFGIGGGLGGVTFALPSSDGFALENNDRRLVYQLNRIDRETIIIRFDDNALALTQPVILTIAATAVATDVGSDFVRTGGLLATGNVEVGRIDASGGDGSAYTYTPLAGSPAFSTDANGVVRFTANSFITSTVTVVVDDADANTEAASVTIAASVRYFFLAGRARAQFTSLLEVDAMHLNGAAGGTALIRSNGKFEFDFPADDGTRPRAFTVTRSFGREDPRNEGYYVIESDILNRGSQSFFRGSEFTYTITILQGSEEYL